MNRELEAVLFAFGRRVKEEELATILKKSVPTMQKALASLQASYTTQDTSLQLVHEAPFWKLTVKDEYLDLVKGIVTRTDLDRPTLETLAVIAFKYPVLQSDVINARGSGAYEHIKALSELGYVVKEKKGRSFQLKLTQKFFDYFDLPREKLKEAFQDIESMAQKIEEQEAQAQELKAQEEEQKAIVEKQKENKTITKYD